MAIELESMKYFRTAQQDAEQQEGASQDDVPGSDSQLASANTIPLVELPSEPGAVARRKPGKLSKRSGWSAGLTWICVFFSLISFTGFCGAGFGIIGLFVEPAKADLSHMEYNERQRVEKLQTQILETRDKYSVVLVYMQLMKLGLAVGFGVCVTMLVTRNGRGRSFAVALCALALMYHAANTGVNFLVSDPGTIMTFVTDSMNAAASEQGVSGEEREEMMTQMQNAMIGGMILYVAVVLVIKFSFYGVIMLHLQQPEIKRIFGDDSLSKLECDAVPAV